MIKFIFFGFFLFVTSSLYSQYNLTQNQFNVIVNISNYTYYQNNYVPFNPYPGYTMGDLLSRTLQTLQARYDYAHKILSEEFNKLNTLTLINDYNVTLLDKTRNQIDEYSAANFTKVDFAESENFTSWLNYITSIYKVPSVKNEIALLQAVNIEINRIRIKNPDTFYTSDRYKEIGSVMAQLKTINKDSIPSLAWKYGLF